MTKNIYFHIGLEKTGSTPLQNFLFCNPDLLKENDFSYPTMPGPYPDRNGTYIMRNIRSDFDLERVFKDYIKAAKSDNIIVSYESVYPIFHRLKKVPGNIDGYKLTVIVYYRRMSDFLGSYWQQIIKDPFKIKLITQNIDEFLEYNIDEDNQDSISSSIIKNLRCLDKIFPKDSIVLRPYEKSSLLEGDIIKDFLNLIKLWDQKDIKQEVEKFNLEYSNNHLKSNISMSRDLCDLAVKYNKGISFLKRSKLDIQLIPDQYRFYEGFVCMENNFHAVPKVCNTIDKKLLKKVSDYFYPFESEISQKYLTKEYLFKERYPDYYYLENNSASYEGVNVDLQKKFDKFISSNNFVSFCQKKEDKIKQFIKRNKSMIKLSTMFILNKKRRGEVKVRKNRKLEHSILEKIQNNKIFK